MKIIFNTDQIFLHGGIEKTIVTRANYFAHIPAVEVCIVTTEQGGRESCYPLEPGVQLIDLDIPYHRHLSYFSIKNLRQAWSHFSRQKKLFAKLKPDVIISPNFNFDHYWLPFSYPGAKVIKERHGSRYAQDLARHNANVLTTLKFWINDWIDARYDYIVVLNQDEKEFVKSKNAVVIPNAITSSPYQAVLNRKQVIAAGRISPVKAFDELIKAWKIVNEEFPDWQLHIYGDDYLDTKHQLLKLIHELHLQNVIILKESVADLREAMRDYSLYAMSSVTECFPMVLLEALSVGLPVVSYDCPTGPRHIITHTEDGYLAEYKNAHDLASKLMTLMKDETLRKAMGRNAKRNSARFAVDLVMKQWEALLNIK